MIAAVDIFVMLLTEEKFKTFTPKDICDATKSTEVLVCLSCESRVEVDEIVRKAVAAGGTTYNDPQDHGFMYGHGFQDLDGHIWELIFMEPTTINCRNTLNEVHDEGVKGRVRDGPCLLSSEAFSMLPFNP